MTQFGRKPSSKDMIFSYAMFVVLLVVIGFLVVSVWHRYEIEREMFGRREQAESELQLLRQRAAALETKVEYLQDERGIEAEIRGRFDVAKEGEQVVIIIDNERSDRMIEPVRAPVPLSEETPWYKFWQ